LAIIEYPPNFIAYALKRAKKSKDRPEKPDGPDPPHLSAFPQDLAPYFHSRLPDITGPVPSVTLDKEIFNF